MTTPGTQPPYRPETRFFGWLLIVIGGLLVLLCGGCTLVMWGVGVVGLTQSPSAWGSLVGLFFVTLLIGGLPAAGGAVLVWAGWRTLHLIRTPRATAKTFE